MELITLLAMFGASALLALIGGVFIGRGDKVEKLHEVEQVNSSKSTTIESLQAEINELKRHLTEGQPEPANKFEGDDTEVIDRSTADQLEAEVEILRTELVNKEKEVEKLEANNNRLGGRILEIENELQQKEALVMQTVMAKESAAKSELIKEGMDSFLEALQKESDILRGELENAYRMINRQEKELSRYRGEADEPTIDKNELYNRIEQLTEQNDQLLAAISSYEDALKEHAEESFSADPTPPEPEKHAPTNNAPATPSIYGKKESANLRKKKSISSFRTVRNSIVPERDTELPPKERVPGTSGTVPASSPPPKRVTNSQKLKTIVPKGGIPQKPK